MIKIFTALFTFTFSIQIFALSRPEIQRAEKSADGFILALKDSIEFNQRVSAELAKGDTKLEVARAALQTIAVIEAGYWSGRAILGSRLATNYHFWSYWTPFSAETGIDVATLLGGILSGEGAGIAVTDFGKEPRFIYMKKAVFSGLFPDGAEGLIKKTTLSINSVDLGLRNDGELAKINFSKQTENFKENYKLRILSDIKYLRSTYNKAAADLQIQISKLLNEKDPINKNYLSKILSLGGDQLNYGHAVAATIEATVELNKAFLKMAQNLKSELAAANSL